ncbi:MAG: GntR family transcriptional regulator [Gammaproteobacteria bacterium]|jgi:GntR family transcriptional regulator|nr:GntR family transcriptional regulator [Gammaproteobacteria bacterium]
MRQSAARRKLGSVERTVTPLYHQVYLALRQKILNGECDPKLALPGEHQLAAQYGVSRVTVRRTLEALELEGLVSRRRGIGTFPVEQAAERQERYNIGGLIGQAPGQSAGQSARTEATTVSIDVMPAPTEVAAQLGPQHANVTRIVRLRSAGNVPYTVMSAWLPQPVAGTLGRRALQSDSLPMALEQAGMALARAEHSITATIADDRVASQLQVPVGAPLIAMRTLFSDANDTPVALIEALFRPDRYEYRTTLLRRGSGKERRWQAVY